MGRLNKRQQREQDTLRDLQGGLGEADSPIALSDEEEDEPVVPARSRATKSLFSAALEVDEVNDDESEEDESAAAPKKGGKSKKKKKKAKSAASTTPADPSSVAPEPHPEASGSQPNPSISAKKQAKKAAKAEKAAQSKLDDIDRALQELSLKSGEPSAGLASASPAVALTTTPAVQKFRELLGVNSKHLDGDAELRRFFGSKVVASAKASGPKHRHATIRSQLTTPPPEWPMVRMSQGLAMRPLDPAEIGRKLGTYPGDKWWTVEHSPSYKLVELEFLETVQLGDYRGFIQILSKHPWHVDSLLQMAEVARQQEDNTQASDFVARSLFAFERSFTSVFNITTGAQRLDFDRIENRPFFLTLARYIVNLQKRGTNRTAFEFAKLLYALDPGSDPHGALFHLDFLAVRSGSYQWLLDMWDVHEQIGKQSESEIDRRKGVGVQVQGAKGDENRVDVRYLPGWWYARALAMRGVEEASGDKVHAKSTEALKEAICAFPSVLPVLADKASINLSSEIRMHPACQISAAYEWSATGESTIHLLSHLYAQRSAELWKVPEAGDWLRKIASDASLLTHLYISSLPSTNPASQIHVKAKSFFDKTGSGSGSTPENIVRHVIVAENRSLMAFFSPNAVPAQVMSYDPVPPRTSLSSYDEAYFAGIGPYGQGAGGRRAGGGRGRGGRGQGGFGEADEEFQMQEMILEELRLRAARQGGGGVPGAFPGGEGWQHEHEGDVDSDIGDEDVGARNANGVEDAEDDEEEEDADVAPPETGGFMQTMYNLVNIWGRRGGAGAGNPPAPNANHAPDQ